MSDRATRLAGLYAAIAAAASVLLSPLLALSYFGIPDGAGQLRSGTVRAWAAPARDLLGGLLTWAPPERVYATYVQAFALIFPAVFLCARAVRARRPAAGRNERWGWRIALAGYGWAALGLLAVLPLLISAPGGDALAVNLVFLTLLLPGMFISAIGSTVLGIALLRSHYTPKLTPWLLTLAFPSMLIIPTVLGHNSLGLVPLILAWGISGIQLWRAHDQAPPSMIAPPFLPRHSGPDGVQAARSARFANDRPENLDGVPR
jgi:hypothetical protein